MKRTIILAIAAIMALGLASCAKEVGDSNKTPEISGKGSLSFTFDAKIGSPVTYADIATTDEWTINSIDIYAFGSNDMFLGKLGENDFSIESEERTSTIIMTQEWIAENINQTITFYFVGNDNGTNGATNAPHIVEFLGTRDEFKALTTNPLVAGTDASKFVNIATPLLFSGVSEPVAITSGKISEEVSLKRREARFDIVNEVPTQFVISEVLISGARRQGYIWADAGVGADITSFAQVSMESVPASRINYVADANEGHDNIAKGVFYLYPTSLDATTITLMASFDGGPEKPYEVVSDIAIDANKRYKLVCKASTTIYDVELSVEPVDYEEGISQNLTPVNETGVSIAGVTPAANYAGGVFTVANNAGGTATVTINSSTGTTATFRFTGGGGNTYTTDFDISEPVSTITYGSLVVVDIYTVTLPVLEDGNMGYDIEAIFISKGDEEQSRTVTFTKGGVQKEHVLYENILCYDEEAGLNLDGVGTPLLFKWGSLIGMGMGPDMGSIDLFDSGDILWAPEEYVGANGGLTGLKEAIDAITGTANADKKARWDMVPYASNALGFDSSFPENTATNIAAGLGDPCRFASKTGYSIGDFKIPALVPTGENRDNWFETIRSGAEDWVEFNDVYGRWNEAGTQFYPATGARDSGIGHSGVFTGIGDNGHYWSSTPYLTFASALVLLKEEGQVGQISYNRTDGFTVRCVVAE